MNSNEVAAAIEFNRTNTASGYDEFWTEEMAAKVLTGTGVPTAFAIVSATGLGKVTMARIYLGLEFADGSQVSYTGEEITRVNTVKLHAQGTDKWVRRLAAKGVTDTSGFHSADGLPVKVHYQV
jgi:hypothetical protein